MVNFSGSCVCISPNIAYCPTTSIQAGLWGAYDARGSPTGDGCKADLVTSELSYPHMSINEIATLFHQKSDKGRDFRLEFQAASSLMTVLLKQKELPRFLPLSTVSVSRSYISETYYELCFMSEADIVRTFNVSARALKLKACKLDLEDGSGQLTGYFVSPTGIPAEIYHGLRRVKVSSNLQHSHTDRLCDPSTQVRQNQPADILQLLVNKLQTNRHPAEKASGQFGLRLRF